MLNNLEKVKSTISKAVVLDPKIEAIQKARADLFMAYHDFENAEGDYVDVAIHKLIAAEHQYGLALAEHADVIQDGIFDADNNIVCRGILRKITVGKVLELHEKESDSVFLDAVI